jgi:hypothetical protein
MVWEIERKSNFILVKSNFNKTKYRKNNEGRFQKLKKIIENNPGNKIIFQAKSNIYRNINKNYYFLVKKNIRHEYIFFKLFSSLEACLNTNEEECLHIDIYNTGNKYYSNFHWLNSKNCNLFKNLHIEQKGGFLIKLLDLFNKYFNVPYCKTSDQALIECENDSNIDLSLTQIFKYGRTYYEKYNFKFNFRNYNLEDNQGNINTEKEYHLAKHKLYNFPMAQLIISEIDKNLEYYLDTLNLGNVTKLGEFMKNILNHNCEDYNKVFKSLIKENRQIRFIITIINDAKNFYVKKYNYNKFKSKKQNNYNKFKSKKQN